MADLNIVDEAQDREEAKARGRALSEAASRKATPTTWVGLQDEAGVTYIPSPDGSVRSRSHLVRGRNWEHTREDADGVWIYRVLG